MTFSKAGSESSKLLHTKMPSPLLHIFRPKSTLRNSTSDKWLMKTLFGAYLAQPVCILWLWTTTFWVAECAEATKELKFLTKVRGSMVWCCIFGCWTCQIHHQWTSSSQTNIFGTLDGWFLDLGVVATFAHVKKSASTKCTIGTGRKTDFRTLPLSFFVQGVGAFGPKNLVLARLPRLFPPISGARGACRGQESAKVDVFNLQTAQCCWDTFRCPQGWEPDDIHCWTLAEEHSVWDKNPWKKQNSVPAIFSPRKFTRNFSHRCAFVPSKLASTHQNKTQKGPKKKCSDQMFKWYHFPF